MSGVASAALYALLYGDREWSQPGAAVYRGLEQAGLKMVYDLTTTPQRPDAGGVSASCALSALPVPPAPDEPESTLDDSLLDRDTTCAAFAWEAWSEDATVATTWLAVFDLNKWYQAHMPSGVDEATLQRCDYFRLYPLEASAGIVMGVSVSAPKQRGGALSVCALLDEGVLPLTFAGPQERLLRALETDGAAQLQHPLAAYQAALRAGLAAPDAVTAAEQREALLTLALETGFSCVPAACAAAWTSGDPDLNGCTLPALLDWLWRRAVAVTAQLDAALVRLFDSTGECPLPEEEMAQLHALRAQIDGLCDVLNVMITRTNNTDTGLNELESKSYVLHVRSLHASVILWLCHAYLLPETGDDSVDMGYPGEALTQWYREQRRSPGGDLLMIDGLIEELGDRLSDVWQEDGDGLYPPHSLQALTRAYLLDGIPDTCKHRITHYLLMDLTRMLSDDQCDWLKSFPSSFAMSPSLIKLTHAFWQLDHGDVESALVFLLDPLVQPADLTRWQHRRLLRALLARGEHRAALRYVRARQPPSPELDDLRLQLRVLLENDLVSEAMRLEQSHRAIGGEQLAADLLRGCQRRQLLVQLMRMPLDQLLERLFVEFLTSNPERDCNELLHVFYLQRGQYRDAAALQRRLAAAPAANPERAEFRDSLHQLLPGLIHHSYSAIDTSRLPKQRTVIAPTLPRKVRLPLSAQLHQLPGTTQSRSTVLQMLMEQDNQAPVTPVVPPTPFRPKNKRKRADIEEEEEGSPVSTPRLPEMRKLRPDVRRLLETPPVPRRQTRRSDIAEHLGTPGRPPPQMTPQSILKVNRFLETARAEDTPSKHLRFGSLRSRRSLDESRRSRAGVGADVSSLQAVETSQQELEDQCRFEKVGTPLQPNQIRSLFTPGKTARTAEDWKAEGVAQRALTLAEIAERAQHVPSPVSPSPNKRQSLGISVHSEADDSLFYSFESSSIMDADATVEIFDRERRLRLREYNWSSAGERDESAAEESGAAPAAVQAVTQSSAIPATMDQGNRSPSEVKDEVMSSPFQEQHEQVEELPLNEDVPCISTPEQRPGVAISSRLSAVVTEELSPLADTRILSPKELLEQARKTGRISLSSPRAAMERRSFASSDKYESTDHPVEGSISIEMQSSSEQCKEANANQEKRQSSGSSEEFSPLMSNRFENMATVAETKSSEERLALVEAQVLVDSGHVKSVSDSTIVSQSGRDSHTKNKSPGKLSEQGKLSDAGDTLIVPETAWVTGMTSEQLSQGQYDDSRQSSQKLATPSPRNPIKTFVKESYSSTSFSASITVESASMSAAPLAGVDELDSQLLSRMSSDCKTKVSPLLTTNQRSVSSTTETSVSKKAMSLARSPIRRGTSLLFKDSLLESPVLLPPQHPALSSVKTPTLKAATAESTPPGRSSPLPRSPRLRSSASPVSPATKATPIALAEQFEVHKAAVETELSSERKSGESKSQESLESSQTKPTTPSHAPSTPTRTRWSLRTSAASALSSELAVAGTFGAQTVVSVTSRSSKTSPTALSEQTGLNEAAVETKIPEKECSESKLHEEVGSSPTKSATPSRAPSTPTRTRWSLRTSAASALSSESAVGGASDTQLAASVTAQSSKTSPTALSDRTEMDKATLEMDILSEKKSSESKSQEEIGSSQAKPATPSRAPSTPARTRWSLRTSAASKLSSESAVSGASDTQLAASVTVQSSKTSPTALSDRTEMDKATVEMDILSEKESSDSKSEEIESSQAKPTTLSRAPTTPTRSSVRTSSASALSPEADVCPEASGISNIQSAGPITAQTSPSGHRSPGPSLAASVAPVETSRLTEDKSPEQSQEQVDSKVVAASKVASLVQTPDESVIGGESSALSTQTGIILSPRGTLERKSAVVVETEPTVSVEKGTMRSEVLEPPAKREVAWRTGTAPGNVTDILAVSMPLASTSTDAKMQMTAPGEELDSQIVLHMESGSDSENSPAVTTKNQFSQLADSTARTVDVGLARSPLRRRTPLSSSLSPTETFLPKSGSLKVSPPLQIQLEPTSQEVLSSQIPVSPAKSSSSEITSLKSVQESKFSPSSKSPQIRASVSPTTSSPKSSIGFSKQFSPNHPAIEADVQEVQETDVLKSVQTKPTTPTRVSTTPTRTRLGLRAAAASALSPVAEIPDARYVRSGTSEPVQRTPSHRHSTGRPASAEPLGSATRSARMRSVSCEPGQPQMQAGSEDEVASAIETSARLSSRLRGGSQEPDAKVDKHRRGKSERSAHELEEIGEIVGLPANRDSSFEPKTTAERHGQRLRSASKEPASGDGAEEPESETDNILMEVSRRRKLRKTSKSKEAAGEQDTSVEREPSTVKSRRQLRSVSKEPEPVSGGEEPESETENILMEHSRRWNFRKTSKSKGASGDQEASLQAEPTSTIKSRQQLRSASKEPEPVEQLSKQESETKSTVKETRKQRSRRTSEKSNASVGHETSVIEPSAGTTKSRSRGRSASREPAPENQPSEVESVAENTLIEYSRRGKPRTTTESEQSTADHPQSTHPETSIAKTRRRLKSASTEPAPVEQPLELESEAENTLSEYSWNRKVRNVSGSGTRSTDQEASIQTKTIKSRRRVRSTSQESEAVEADRSGDSEAETTLVEYSRKRMPTKLSETEAEHSATDSAGSVAKRRGRSKNVSESIHPVTSTTEPLSVSPTPQRARRASKSKSENSNASLTRTEASSQLSSEGQVVLRTARIRKGSAEPETPARGTSQEADEQPAQRGTRNRKVSADGEVPKSSSRTTRSRVSSQELDDTISEFSSRRASAKSKQTKRSTDARSVSEEPDTIAHKSSRTREGSVEYDTPVRSTRTRAASHEPQSVTRSVTRNQKNAELIDSSAHESFTEDKSRKASAHSGLGHSAAQRKRTRRPSEEDIDDASVPRSTRSTPQPRVSEEPESPVPLSKGKRTRKASQSSDRGEASRRAAKSRRPSSPADSDDSPARHTRARSVSVQPSTPVRVPARSASEEPESSRLPTIPSEPEEEESPPLVRSVRVRPSRAKLARLSVHRSQLPSIPEELPERSLSTTSAAEPAAKRRRRRTDDRPPPELFDPNTVMTPVRVVRPEDKEKMRQGIAQAQEREKLMKEQLSSKSKRLRSRSGSKDK